MSRVSTILQSSNAMSIIWSFFFLLDLCVTITCVLLFIHTMFHLHCIPKSAAAKVHSTVNSKYVKSYSTLSVTFAALSAITIFSSYPLCTQLSCVDNLLGLMLDLHFWTFFTLSKLFLYLIFIMRLFNPRYRQIYSYSKFIQYFLWMLLFLLMTTMIEFNIYCGAIFGGIKYPQWLDLVCGAVYAITDHIISVVTSILFFRPLCRRNRIYPNGADVSLLKNTGSSLLCNYSLRCRSSYHISWTFICSSSMLQ